MWSIIVFILILGRAFGEMTLDFIKMCDSKSYDIEVNANVTNNTILVMYYNSTVPITNSGLASTTIFASRDKKTYTKLTKMTSRDPCEGMNKVLGEVWHDLERALHVPNPGSCPIPKGYYMTRNFKPNPARLRLRALPPGFLKLRVSWSNAKATKIYVCVDIGVSNQ